MSPDDQDARPESSIQKLGRAVGEFGNEESLRLDGVGLVRAENVKIKRIN